jgi:hypothetical protein
MNISTSYDPTVFDLPMNRVELLREAIGQRICQIYRIGPEDPIGAPGIMDRHSKTLGFNYYPGTIVLEFDSGYLLGISDDEPLCSLNVATTPTPLEDFTLSGAFVFDVWNPMLSNSLTQRLINERILRIEILQGPAFNARYEGIPRETVLRFRTHSGMEWFCTYRFLEPFHDVFLIVEDVLSESELRRFRNSLKKSKLLKTVK